MAESGTVHAGAGIAGAGVPVETWRAPSEWSASSLVLEFTSDRYCTQPAGAANGDGASLVLDFQRGDYFYDEAPATSGTAFVDNRASAALDVAPNFQAHPQRLTAGAGALNASATAAATAMASVLVAGEAASGHTALAVGGLHAYRNVSGHALCQVPHYWQVPEAWQSSSLVLDFASGRYGTQQPLTANAAGPSLDLGFTSGLYFATPAGISGYAHVDDYMAGVALPELTAQGAGAGLYSVAGSVAVSVDCEAADGVALASGRSAAIACASVAAGSALADFALSGAAGGAFAHRRVITEAEQPASLALDFTEQSYAARVVAEHAQFFASGTVSASAQASGHCQRRIRVKQQQPLIVPSPVVEADPVVWAIGLGRGVGRALPFGTTWHLLYGKANAASAASGVAEHRRAVAGVCRTGEALDEPSLVLDFATSTFGLGIWHHFADADVEATGEGHAQAAGAELDSDPLVVLQGVRHWSARTDTTALATGAATPLIYAVHHAVGRAQTDVTAVRLPGGKVICAPTAEVRGYGLIQTPFIGNVRTDSQAGATANARLLASGHAQVLVGGEVQPASAQVAFLAAADLEIGRIEHPMLDLDFTSGTYSIGRWPCHGTAQSELLGAGDAQQSAASERAPAVYLPAAQARCPADCLTENHGVQIATTAQLSAAGAAAASLSDVASLLMRGTTYTESAARTEVIGIATTLRACDGRAAVVGDIRRDAPVAVALTVVSDAAGRGRARFNPAALIEAAGNGVGDMVFWPKIPVSAQPVFTLATVTGFNRASRPGGDAAPASRTVVVSPESRELIVAAESRTIEVAGGSRRAAA